MIWNHQPWSELPFHVRFCLPRLPLEPEYVLPSGLTLKQLVRCAHDLIPRLHDLYCPPLLPKDLLCLLGEALASVHCVLPCRGRAGVDLSDLAAGAAINCTWLAATANLEYARYAGLVRTILLPGEPDESVAFLNELEDWERNVRRPAYARRDEDPRSARIDWCISDLVRRTYNPDYEKSVRRIERILVDHAGGNEGLAASRESVGRNRRERGSICASYARMIIDRGLNIWDYSGARLVIDRAKLREGLDDLLERGVARKAGRSEAADKEFNGSRRKTRSRRALESIDGVELADPGSNAEWALRLALEELREARDYFEQRGDRWFAEALQALSAKALDEDFAVVTHRAKRLAAELHGQSQAVRAAAAYEFLGRSCSQEEVAQEYGVSRYELQAQLAQAERIMERLSAA